jgi:pSer/pThr/pTyr-binding forkhead associated (FHA) protein
MPKLVLKYENEILQETMVGREPVGIGRSPENRLVIDNPAVSHRHARVTDDKGRLMLEDFGSLNGTYVNGRRVKMTSLKAGDTVSIGKHKIVVVQSFEPDGYWNSAENGRRHAPKIDETMLLVTKERVATLQRAAEAGESSQIAPERMKIPTLRVRRGRTNKREYMLTDKLTVIGKSVMATVKLRSWFAPQAAAQINRREDDGYYVGPAAKIPCVNGCPSARPTKLLPGDIIEVAGIQLEFAYRD